MTSITAFIDGHEASRDEVLSWERDRAAAVLAKLGANTRGDVTVLRQAHVERKLELGHDGIERLLERPLRAADRAGRIGVTLSRGRRRLCSIELKGTGASVEPVPSWYRETITANNEVPLIEACPDHYISRTRPDGRQEVIEKTGGSPMPVRMFFDDEDISTLTSGPDPAFPVEWASVARNESGKAIGGVRHLFRDEPAGFCVRLTVEFPLATPPSMIRQHRWHLACEFSNWIEAANQI